MDVKENKNILILTMIIGGIIGYIYEIIFYRIDLGYFTNRGSTFGPWIPIYAFGSLFLALLVYPYRKNIGLTFFLCFVVTTFLEYMTGFVLFHFFHTRLWDYNTEIWNFGNIQGFICLRSVLLFACAGMFLVYVLIPFLEKLQTKVSLRKMNIVCNTLLALFVLDMLIYQILH